MPENIEIERRFLVDGRQQRVWIDESLERIEIRQWYLDSTQLSFSENGAISYGDEVLVTGIDPTTIQSLDSYPNWTARIRTWNKTCFLTLKGLREGALATEYEWEIGRESTDRIVESATYPYIEKNRYLWNGKDGLIWEIDEFEGDLAGMIIAEVELEYVDSEIEVPSWAGMELTHLNGWSNAALARMLTQK
tara:strand:+ start:360 stop:935 length:576 start_codon:yes stop_codon:yes gene_type:complete